MKKYLVIMAIAFTGLLAAQSGVVDLPVMEVSLLQAQDDAAGAERISAAQQLPTDIEDSGEWTSVVSSGGKTELAWTIDLRIPGAPGLGLFIDQLDMAEGDRLSWSAPNQPEQTFTQADANDLNRVFLGFVSGEIGRLQYYPDSDEIGELPFNLWRIDQLYRPERYQAALAKDFGDSNDCQIDANCPEGDGWDDQKSSNARLLVVVVGGTGICSGNLMNNTAENGRPLLLTGYHCFDGFTPLYDLWEFDFGFRFSTCGSTNPNPPSFVKYEGSTYLAGRQENDFLLLEITDPTFDADFHYFAGWDRSDGDVAGDLIVFHHPAADVQKLSTGNGMTIFNGPINWNNDVTTPASHHFRMDVEVGNADPGSSGSTVFDENRRVRGHINGGIITCPDSDPFLWIGRLHMAWTGGGTPQTRLSDWLDPLQLDTLQWDGRNLAGNTSGRVLRGYVRNNGTGIAGVEVYCQWDGGPIDTVITDSVGYYSLPRPAANDLTISGFYQTDDPTDEVDVLDMVAARRHILGLDTLSPIAIVSGDVTNDGFIATTDVFRISQAILGLNEWVERPSWFLFPTLLPLDPIPTGVWNPVTVTINNPQAVVAELDLILVKNGDTNLSGG